MSEELYIYMIYRSIDISFIRYKNQSSKIENMFLHATSFENESFKYLTVI